MVESKESSLHIVVFPWLVFGHIIPFLELSEQLTKRGHFVTFVSAPRNLAKLRPVAPDVRPRIRLVPLPLPLVDGLPNGAESTADVPPEKVELLKIAFDGLAAPFDVFLTEDVPVGRLGKGTPRSPTRSSSTSHSSGFRPSPTSIRHVPLTATAPPRVWFHYAFI